MPRAVSMEMKRDQYAQYLNVFAHFSGGGKIRSLHIFPDFIPKIFNRWK
jgi:hypothetical protein